VKKFVLLVFFIICLSFALQQGSESQAKPEQRIQLQETAARSGKAGVFLHSSKLQKKSSPIGETELRDASTKAIRLIQRSQTDWSKKETCSSCHHQLLPEIPFKLARERGLRLDESAARESTVAAFSFLKDFDGLVQGYDYIDVFFDGLTLVAAQNAGIRPNLSTAASAQFIASRQRPDGSWYTIDGRPPQAHSLFATTAICIKALQDYLPEALRIEKENRVRRARGWLLKAHPQTIEDRVFQLFGLYWTGADLGLRKRLAQQLLAQQQKDGGWSQLQGLASDAYSTGEVLVALQQAAELSTGSSAYQQGLQFLLKTQEADGSWHVNSRLHPPAPVSPPYFETGFPYKHDQFISIMGTSWAAAALLQAIPAQAKGTMQQTAPASIEPDEKSVWAQVALSGSVADLKRLLDGGLKPDTRTAEGTTALMLAARDLEKVKLLIERGADINARAATGFTPLMIASRFTGNVEVVRLLLKKGAQPNAGTGVEVRNDTSALFLAVTAGDVQIVKALLDAGAKLNSPMKLIGRIPITPLFYASVGGDAAMVEELIRRGSNPNEVDGDGISALGWATINNHANVAQVLLAHGAEVNHLDNFAMTPLLYAASIDFGNTTVMEKLMAAGANLKLMNKQGQTAIDLTKNYHYPGKTHLLTKRTIKLH
jgi:ankyrin repeat protein